MDSLDFLESCKTELLNKGNNIRKQISVLIDEGSFVELDRFSFSKNEFYGETVQGEGVVTGYATMNDFPVYIVAQNAEVLNGGLSLAGCRKIIKCLDKAYDAAVPVVYLLSSLGVQAGEGISAMEGVAELLKKVGELKLSVPQFSIVLGDVFGSSSMIAALSDYTFMVKDSCLAYASPTVIAAKSKVSADKLKVCGADACTKNGLANFSVKNVEEARDYIVNIFDILPDFGGSILETGDDDNRCAPELNKNATASGIISSVFDNGYFIELGKGSGEDVITAIGRIGGYSVASIIFDGGDKGVELNALNTSKIAMFVDYAQSNGLPLVTFTNTLGIEQNVLCSNSNILKNISSIILSISNSVDIPKINVIYKNAVGLGYSLFGSKALGANYNFAFASSVVAPFTSEVGAQIEYGVNGESLEKLKAKYITENSKPLNAAKEGFVDNIIEPQFVRQYVISALQMLV